MNRKKRGICGGNLQLHIKNTFDFSLSLKQEKGFLRRRAILEKILFST
jgi:hypothetical protein